MICYNYCIQTLFQSIEIFWIYRYLGKKIYFRNTKGDCMIEREKAMEEFKKYERMRQEMYDLFERYIPKKGDGTFDFSEAKCIDAKEIFDLCFKLDYQARKIRGIAIKALGLQGE